MSISVTRDSVSVTPFLYPLMKTMIFAAGMGTRLRPLTDTRPKALVPVAGRPLLDITLRRLVDAGATEAVVNVHHFGEQIIDYLDKHDYGIPVHISDECAALLNTGGGLRHAAPLLASDERPVLIHNVDILHNADLAAFYAANLDADAALMVSSRETKRYLLFDDDQRLVGWTNIETGEVRSPYASLDLSRTHRYAFSGIHSFSPRLFPLMEDFPAAFSIIDFYLSVCHRISIKGHPVNDLRLLDVGKQDTLAVAEHFLRENAVKP